jgi:hypothetical protein
MISEIIKEKTSADHLLYVSLKYTKTCDVILNLLARWKSLIELSFNTIIEESINKGKIPEKPISPKQSVEFIKKYFKNYKGIQESIPFYIFLKRIPECQKTREGEFRKNVNLKVKIAENTTIINLIKLDEYSEIIDKFLKDIKEILS